MAAASVLSYRLPHDEYQNDIEFVIESSHNIHSKMSNFVPG